MLAHTAAALHLFCRAAMVPTSPVAISVVEQRQQFKPAECCKRHMAAGKHRVTMAATITNLHTTRSVKVVHRARSACWQVCHWLLSMLWQKPMCHIRNAVAVTVTWYSSCMHYALNVI